MTVEKNVSGRLKVKNLYFVFVIKMQPLGNSFNFFQRSISTWVNATDKLNDNDTYPLGLHFPSFTSVDTIATLGFLWISPFPSPLYPNSLLICVVIIPTISRKYM